MTLLLLALFLAAVFLGMPLAFAFGAASLTVVLLMGPVSVTSMAHAMFAGLNNFVLISVPLFILVSSVMVASGMALRIFLLFGGLLDRIRGGLAGAVVASAMFFAGITGSTVADAAAVAKTTLPMADTLRYDRGFLAGLIAASGTFGILIPPSLTMIVYGAITGESIGKLFMAGLVPGLAIGAAMTVVAVWLARRRRYGVAGVATAPVGRLAGRALPGVVVPLLIIGGIYGGVFTATESAAVAGVYAVVVAILSGVGWRALWESLEDAADTTAQIMVIVAAALFVGTLMAHDGASQRLLALLQAADLSPWMFLVLINVVYLALGLLLDGFTILMLTVPVVYPLLGPLGISPIHFAVMATVNIEIGTITPPMGVNLFALASIAQVSIGEVFRQSFPFLLVLGAGLIAVTFAPQFSLWLPGMLR